MVVRKKAALSWEEESEHLKKQNVGYRKRIAVLEEREEILQQSFREITTLHRLSQKINSAHDFNQILETLLDVAKEVVDYKSAALLLQDADNTYRIALKRRLSKQQSNKIDTQIKQGLIDWAIEQHKPTIIPDLSNKNITTKKSYILAPLIINAEVKGVLYLEASADDYTVTQQRFQMISLLVNQAAIALLNAQLYQKILEKTTAVTSVKNFLESVLAGMSDCLLVFDGKNRVVRVNDQARQLFGWSDRSVEKKTIEEVFPRRLATFFSHLVKLSAQKRKALVKQVDCQTKDGYFPLEVIASPLKSVDRKNQGVIAVCRDLTERVELLELKRLDQVKSELISNISHEMRTPLTSIRVCGETLLDHLGKPDPDLMRNYLEIILEQSNKLNLTIGNFLELALLESHERVITKKRTSARTIVERALESLDVGDATIETFFAEKLPLLMVDEFELSLALANLIHNGLNFSRDKKKVRIEVIETQKGHRRDCCFRVIDWGIGIDEKFIPRLGEKFFRVDSSLSAEMGGAGIGLAIVRKIVEAHKGRLEIESTINKGSTFSLCIAA